MERGRCVCGADVEIADFRIAALDRHDILARRLAIHVSLIFRAQATLFQMIVSRSVDRHSGETTHIRPTKTLCKKYSERAVSYGKKPLYQRLCPSFGPLVRRFFVNRE